MIFHPHRICRAATRELAEPPPQFAMQFSSASVLFSREPIQPQPRSKIAAAPQCKAVRPPYHYTIKGKQLQQRCSNKHDTPAATIKWVSFSRPVRRLMVGAKRGGVLLVSVCE